MARTKTPKTPAVLVPLPQAAQTPAYIPAIIKALADTALKNNDTEVVTPTKASSCRVRLSMTKPFDSAPKDDLGTIREFPLEILHMICLSLDLTSCFVLRQVNRQSRCFVSSLPQYSALVNHALECLQVVFRSRAARKVTVDDLYQVLCHPECMVCSSSVTSNSASGALTQPQYDDYAPSPNMTLTKGSGGKVGKTKKTAKATVLAPSSAAAVTGGPAQLLPGTVAKTDGMFLFLPTMTRCCRACLEESPRTRAVPLIGLTGPSDLELKDFESVLISVPFKKRIKRNKKKEHVDLLPGILSGTVSQRDAVRVLLGAGFTRARVKEVLYQSGYLNEFAWPDELYQRGVFTTTMPFLDRRAQQAYRGFTCLGCQEAEKEKFGHLKVRLQYLKPVYGTQAGFLRHVSQCPEAIRLWTAVSANFIGTL